MGLLQWVALVALVAPALSAVQWYKLNEKVDEQQRGKPVMLLMTKSGCKPCEKLETGLESNKEFAEMAKTFVLFKATDKEIPADTRYKMDGKYVPKIIFMDAFGDILNEVVNVDMKNEKAKYFYSKVEHVVKSMNTTAHLTDLDHGFGKDYHWHTYEKGLEVAKKEDKPILMVFHQDWCGACARLKPKVAESQEMKDLASHFVMINTDDEKLVKGEKYKSDGEYYPKILFLESDGELMTKEWNHGTPHKHVLHYYGDGEEISISMKRVLANRTRAERADDRGFGSHIKWVTYQSGLKTAADKKMPMMLIIHKTYCGACKALKPKIRNSEDIGKLSEKFVMVNCEDDEEPYEDQFDIDGAYIPRIFFLGSDGRVEASIKSEEKDFQSTAYAYGAVKSIVASMHKALEMKLGDRVSGGQQQQQQEQQQHQQQQQQQQPQQQQQEQEQEEQKTHDAAGFPLLRFGPAIRWFEYEDGLREAKKSHKPAMLVFYNDYCQFSSFMIKQMHDSAGIVDLAKKFVMVKIEEQKYATIKDKERFDLDGTYTPKIIFMDPDQNIYPDINNTATAYPQTMYYYGHAESIGQAMEAALKRMNLTLGNGFGEYIEWVSYEKSFEIAAEENKPMMLIIHKTWCGACAALKPKIEWSRPIWELSKYFVMVNVEDDQEPLDNQYFIDGGYYPRIFFLNPQGKVDKTMHNRDPAFLKHKYSYGNEEHLLMTMQFAVHKYTLHLREQQQQQTQYQQQTTPQQQQQQQQQQQNQAAKTPQPPAPPQTPQTQDQPGFQTSGKQLLRMNGAPFKTIYEAEEEAKKTGKPVLFLIHRTTCPSCKALIKTISRDKDFKDKTSKFLLADIEDDVDDKKADSYDVDGGYVPRIYFLDPEGQIISDIWNVGTNYPSTKYYYYDLTSVYKQSEKALKHMETWKPGQNKRPKKDEL